MAGSPALEHTGLEQTRPPFRPRVLVGTAENHPRSDRKPSQPSATSSLTSSSSGSNCSKRTGTTGDGNLSRLHRPGPGVRLMLIERAGTTVRGGQSGPPVIAASAADGITRATAASGALRGATFSHCRGCPIDPGLLRLTAARIVFCIAGVAGPAQGIENRTRPHPCCTG